MSAITPISSPRSLTPSTDVDPTASLRGATEPAALPTGMEAVASSSLTGFVPSDEVHPPGQTPAAARMSFLANAAAEAEKMRKQIDDAVMKKLAETARK